MIESVDLLAGAQGQVLRSEIRGNIKVSILQHIIEIFLCFLSFR